LRKIGIIGGISWESTAEYYRIINEEVKERVGGSHSAECLMYSFDFGEVEKLQSGGEWEELTRQMVFWAGKLKNAGADFIIICANTMHMMAPDIEKECDIKVLHIADVTGRKIRERGFKKVALLGTRYVMEGTFYHDVLKQKHDIDVINPSKEQREIVHNIIYDELIKGVVKNESRKKYVEIIEDLERKGAQGVVLGCTEIPMLVSQKDVSIPVFSTTEIHAKAAVDFALDD